MAKRANCLVFSKIVQTELGFRFFYKIDGLEYSFFNSTNNKISIKEDEIYQILANIGLAYLIDLATITLPKKIVIKTIKLTDTALNFWRKALQNFALERVYEEKLPLSFLKNEWIVESNINMKVSLNHRKTGKILIAMSGGKESLSLVKFFENIHGSKITLFFLHYPDKNWYHAKKVYEELKRKFPVIKIRTDISSTSKLLKTYNRKDYSLFVIGQVIFNMLLFAQDFDYFIIGNEYSSNFINTVYKGLPLNHQYDKTIFFAEDINKYIKNNIYKYFYYFSPFFGLYEYKIASLFFSNNKYLNIWTSCNYSSSKNNFCCRCPKCAFTYAISLVYSSKEFLSRFFKKNMFDDLSLYKPLIDFKSPKPLDCVGEKEEVWHALYSIFKQKKDISSKVMKYFIQRIYPKIKDNIKNMETKLNDEHTRLKYLPEEYKEYFISEFRLKNNYKITFEH